MRRKLLHLITAAVMVYACSADEISFTDQSVSEDGESSAAASVIRWSEAACVTSLEDRDRSFPILVTEQDDLVIKYSSSKTSVATIDAVTGDIEVSGLGSTVISATTDAGGTIGTCTASYILSVIGGDDKGADVSGFDASGGAADDADEISNTVFTRQVRVVYSSSGATVSGTGSSGEMAVDISGSHVTVNYTGSENVVYVLTGYSRDGSFKLYSSKKQAIRLSGLSLANPSGAAINNQSHKRTFVYVEGTNSLSDGASAAYAATGEEDLKAVFFSEGQLVFSSPSSGDNSLTVNALNALEKSALASDDYVRVMSCPVLTLNASDKAGHGIKANDGVRISDGKVSVTVSGAMKKGINSDAYVLVEGGTTTISVSGDAAYDKEDSEYKGSAGINADDFFGMTGGELTITNSGTGGKGIKAGSYGFDPEKHSVTDSYISGGVLVVKTTGSEYSTGDVSSKGIKVGWVTKSGSGSRAKVSAYAGNLIISGGKVKVSSLKSEGIEAKGNLTVSGGELYVDSSSDDAVNSQAEMDVTGGYVYAFSSANDAMDANHDMVLSGGYVFAVCTAGTPEVALDANTEDNYSLKIESGAVVVAYGGLERGYSAGQSVYSMTCSPGNWNALYGGGSYIAAFCAPSNVSSAVVSAPSLSKAYKGVNVDAGAYRCFDVWASSEISGGSEAALSAYSGGQGGPGGPGGGGGWH